jgi:Holliday junction resolvasome RuvABC endonuclease subunit
MHYVIGIDPGTTTGWAIVEHAIPWKYVASGEIELSNQCTATAFLESLLYPNRRPERVMVAIEDQYLDKNVATTIKLARMSGRWEEAALHMGLNVKMINPKSWQSSELGKRSMLRKQIKALARTKVRSLYGPLAAASEHSADAVLIARYWASESWILETGRAQTDVERRHGKNLARQKRIKYT